MDREKSPADGIKLVALDGHPINPDTPVDRRQFRKRDSHGRIKAWVPTRNERRMVEICMAAGMTVEQAAQAIGKDRRTVADRCQEEIDHGRNKCNGKVVSKLFEKCMAGDTVSLLFWCKTRLGWQEKNRLEHTGADGGAIQLETATAEANAFTARILAMAQRFHAVPPSNDAAPAPERRKRRKKANS